MGIITANVVTWLLSFFHISEPAQILAGQLEVASAWRWITYPLVGSGDVFFFALFMFVFWWIGSSLERSWGSLKFGRVFWVVTLGFAFSTWLGTAILTQNLQPLVTLAGLHGPELTLFVMWAAMNPMASVLLFFVIPVQARWLALAMVLFSFVAAGPKFGLFAILVPVLGWFWVRRSSGAAPGPSSRRSLSQWWRDRKRAKQKTKFKPIEGGRGLGVSALEPGTRPKLRSTVVGQIEESSSEVELNRILDKINAEGMDSLTDEERETLDSRSRRLRDND